MPSLCNGPARARSELIDVLVRFEIKWEILPEDLLFLTGHELMIRRAQQDIFAPSNEDRRHSKLCAIVEVNLFHFVRIGEDSQDFAS